MSTIQIQKKKLPTQVQRILDTLRNAKCPQIKGAFFDEEGGRCALGVLIEEFRTEGLMQMHDAKLELYGLAGLDYKSDMNISTLNDRGWTFKQIADYMESRIQ